MFWYDSCGIRIRNSVIGVLQWGKEMETGERDHIKDLTNMLNTQLAIVTTLPNL